MCLQLMTTLALLCPLVLSLLPFKPAAAAATDGIPRRCASKKCCKPREDFEILGNSTIHCPSLSIEECVLNDDICEWQCESGGRLGKGRRTFVKFDNGMNGHPSAPQYNSTANLSAHKPPRSIREMQQSTSFLTYGKECGDVYRNDIDELTALQRLVEQDTHTPRSVGSKSGGTGQIRGNNNERGNNSEHALSDMHTSLSSIVRRLQITGDDGREQASATSFPWTTAVLISYDRGDSSYYCSGTMISEKTVLTAAHCLYDLDTDQWGSNYEVLIGSDDNSDTWWPFASWIDWSHAMVPTAYTQKSSFSSSYDFGVIRLDEEPGAGYMGFGYDDSFSVPESFNTFGYPGDKTWGELWRQYCAYDSAVEDYYFRSTECDIYPGQSGSAEYLYWSSTGTRIIYGVASAYSGTTYTYASRITSGYFDLICDFIIEGGETERCS